MSRFLTPPRRALGVGILARADRCRSHRGSSSAGARADSADDGAGAEPDGAAGDDLRGPVGAVREPGRRRSTSSSASASIGSRCSCRGARWRPTRARTRDRTSTPPRRRRIRRRAGATFDAIVRAAAARGVGLDLALEAPAPLWATGPGVPPRHGVRVPRRLGAVAHGVRAVRPRGRHPLQRPLQARRASSPAPAGGLLVDLERAKLRPAARAAGRSTTRRSRSPPLSTAGCSTRRGARSRPTGHGHDTVLIGEIAPRGHHGRRQPGELLGHGPAALHPGAVLRGRLAASAPGASRRPSAAARRRARGRRRSRDKHPALFRAAGFAFHPYPQGFAPNVGTPDGLGADYADLPQLHKLERTLDGALSAYGSSTRFPLYDTEFGYQTNPPEATISRAVHPTRAAAFDEPGRVHELARCVASCPGTSTSWPTRPRRQQLRHRPAVLRRQAERRSTTRSGCRSTCRSRRRRAGTRLEVWGCVRPAHYPMQHSKVPQVAQVQFQPAARRALHDGQARDRSPIPTAISTRR